MELWYSERHTDHVKFLIEVNEQLYCSKSRYQKIEVYDSPEFGHFLVLDGCLMITERDGFIYHEMMVHVPMAVHPDARRILVMGANDGGVVHELLKYKDIEYIDVVELDEEVVAVSRQFFPKTSGALSSDKVHIHHQDGLKFIRRRPDEYDIVIVDFTNPYGPGESFFTKEFYGNCHHALREDGIIVSQHENAFYANDAAVMTRVRSLMTRSFPMSQIYQAHIPTFPSGHWLFGIASKLYDPVRDLVPERWSAKNIPTRYYNPRLHIGAFALPNYVEEMVETLG